jgi:hypothetical protein
MAQAASGLSRIATASFFSLYFFRHDLAFPPTGKMRQSADKFRDEGRPDCP